MSENDEWVSILCKKDFGCIKFNHNGTYKLYDVKDIDNEITEKKKKRIFRQINKI
jgi:hypothetical protein